MSYTKLFSTIIHSTIWRAPDHVRLVWVTMLAMADKDGCVYASVPGLADAARVSENECDAALAALMSPDVRSRTRDREGRRIEEIDGGWWLINYQKYRDMLSEADRRERNRIRVARHRRKKRDVTDVTGGITNNACNDTQKQKQKQKQTQRQEQSARATDDEAHQDPTVAALVAAIEGDQDLSRAIADPLGFAERIAGRLIASGRPVAWAIDALGRAADRAAAARMSGDRMPPATVADMAFRYASDPMAPRKAGQASSGDVAEAEHRKTKREMAKAQKALAAKLEREGVLFEPA